MAMAQLLPCHDGERSHGRRRNGSARAAALEDPAHLDMRQHKPRIRKVVFSLMSSEEIDRNSVVRVTDPTIYERTIPRTGGVNDLRMGSIDRRFRCSTCGKGLLQCVGHNGSMRLAFPVYHVLYVSEVAKVLGRICFFCSSSLSKEQQPTAADPSIADTNNRRSLITDPKKQFHNEVKSQKVFLCSSESCGAPQPSYNHVMSGQDVSIRVTWKDCITRYTTLADKEKDSERKDAMLARVEQLQTISKQPFTAADAVRMLYFMSDDTCRALGFDPSRTHPKHMIITTLLVPSPIIRPSAVTSEGRSRCSDDLTEKLRVIVSINSDLRAKINKATAGQTDELIGWQELAHNKAGLADILATVKELQYQIAVYMHNDCRGLKTDRQRSGAATKSVGSRSKGKEGRIRGTLTAKRCDKSARTVISPDPNLEIDEIGVPEQILRTILFGERVTRWNMSELLQRVWRGPDHIMGAASVIRCDGTELDLRYVEDRKRVELHCGDTVNRTLQRGESVLFNRQPSLHKRSFMSHRVVPVPGKTFRMNCIVCNPYNADFDGDEMNLHVPQSYEAKAESSELENVTRNIVSAKFGKPCLGLIQDACLGIYFLTRDDVFFEKEEACQLLMQCRYPQHPGLPDPAVVKPRRLWTGKQLVSCCIPPGLHLRLHRGNNAGSGGDDDVIIHHGELIKGRLDSRTLGTSHEAIHLHICRLPVSEGGGGTTAARYLFDMQLMANWYLMNRGFSIGIRDHMLPAAAKRTVCETNETLISTVRELQDRVGGEKKGGEGGDLEHSVTALLRRGLGMGAHIADQALDEQNSIFCTVHSGSKGSIINMGQIMSMVGQQFLEGQRLPVKSLSAFDSSQKHPEARGYVPNSLFDGLNPTEFLDHAAGGREGIVDTAVKTSVTGYLQRCLMQALSDIATEHDGTVRRANGHIVQFKYAGDGWDGVKLSRAILRAPPSSYLYARPPTPPESRTIQWFEEKMREMACQLRHKGFPIHLQLPVDLNNELYSAQRRVKWNPLGDGGMDAAAILGIVREELIEKCPEIAASLELSYYVLHFVYDKFLKCCDTLGGAECEPVVVVPNCSEALLRDLANHVRIRCRRAVVEAYEMVGPEAGSVIGENFTQMTLNTFHLAGVSSRVVSAGIPRIRELVFVAKTLKTPSMRVYMNRNISDDPKTTRRWARSLESTDLKDLIVDHGSGCFSTKTKEDDDESALISDIHNIFDVSEPPMYEIRFHLNKDALLCRGLFPRDIASLIYERIAPNPKGGNFENGHSWVRASEPSMREWFVWYRPPGQNPSSAEESRRACEDHRKELERNVHVCGIVGVTGHDVEDGDNPVVHTEGANLRAAWSTPGCEWRKTTSNVLQEIEETLGIEAAHEILFREFCDVLAGSAGSVSPRHLLLVVDYMTRPGYLVPITRHGFTKLNSVFSRAAFEESLDNLSNAARFSEEDPMQDVTSNLIVGQTVPVGTGRVTSVMKPGYIEAALKDPHFARTNTQSEKEIAVTSADPDLSMLEVTVSKGDKREECATTNSTIDPLADWIPPSRSVASPSGTAAIAADVGTFGCLGAMTHANARVNQSEEEPAKNNNNATTIGVARPQKRKLEMRGGYKPMSPPPKRRAVQYRPVSPVRPPTKSDNDSNINVDNLRNDLRSTDPYFTELQ